jgi:hypothetical protein
MSPSSTRPANAGPHGKDEIEGAGRRPRRRADLMRNSKIWMALGWLLVILLLVFPFPWAW